MTVRDLSLVPKAHARALFERISARDVRALSELYDCYSPLIYGLALRIVGDRHEAEDVLHQVFAAAWNQSYVRDAGQDSPAAWLVRTARGLALAQDRTRPVPGAAPPSRPTDHAGKQATSRGAQERPAVQALAALACEQRQLIEDAYFLGLTQSQLAARHELPLDTVKARIRTGLLTLRQHLSQTTHDQ